MAELSYMKDREDMSKVAHYMWDRRLTNAAGGNFAVRVDDNRILISPSLMSERHFCEMKPEDFLLIDYDMNILEGTGKLSREAYMHVLLLKNFKNIGATIHAHPMYCMVFVAQTKPIPNITEATMKRGPVECIHRLIQRTFMKRFTNTLMQEENWLRNIRSVLLCRCTELLFPVLTFSWHTACLRELKQMLSATFSKITSKISDVVSDMTGEAVHVCL